MKLLSQNLLTFLRCSLLIISLLSTHCASSEKSSEDSQGAYPLTGVIHYINIDSGCWQLRSEQNQLYELVGNDMARLLKNDDHVQLIVQSINDQSSLCTSGQLVEIIEIINITH